MRQHVPGTSRTMMQSVGRGFLILNGSLDLLPLGMIPLIKTLAGMPAKGLKDMFDPGLMESKGGNSIPVRFLAWGNIMVRRVGFEPHAATALHT